MLSRPSEFDLIEWVEANLEKIKQQPYAKQSKKPTPPPNPNRSKIAYTSAMEWISTAKPAIEGQNGNAHTFGVACTLVKGFCLSFNEALSCLSSWNAICVPPWSQSDLEQKIIAAEKSPDLQPKGWKLREPRPRPFDFIDSTPEEEAKPDLHRHSNIIDDPASIAIRFLENNKTPSGLCAYRWWQGQFYKWNGSHYDRLEKDKFDSDVFSYIEKEFYEKYQADCAEVPLGADTTQIKKKKLSKTLIENVKVGLVNLISIDQSVKSEPEWIETYKKDWLADDMIISRNRLIHLPSFVRHQKPAFIAKTPRFFSTYSLKYNFDYDFYSGLADAPPIWGKFLTDVWPDDPESIACLRQFFGYFLTPCTKFQKMLMLIGPKRSGKGTIIRTLKHMIGSENICFPTFKSLTTQFGKQSLLGKNLAVFPDARITSRTDTGDVVETILSITGEDDQTVERKHLPSITTHLPTRFIISTNELPRLTENSGALVSRAIVLKFQKTFIDHEDTELEEKLIPEIPAILRWSIDGWKQLYEAKKFLQPESGQQMVNEFLHLSSPISHFLSDNIDIDPAFSSNTKTLFDSWKVWCEWHHRENIGDLDGFIRNLRSAVPTLEFSSHNVPHNGDQVMWAKMVRGIRIKPTKADLESENPYETAKRFVYLPD